MAPVAVPVAPATPFAPSKVAASTDKEAAAPALDPHDFVSRSLTPFNAEPKISRLLDGGGFYTPQRLLFHRNRDPLPGHAFPGVTASTSAAGSGKEDAEWTVALDIEAELRSQWQLGPDQASRTLTLGQLKTAYGTPDIVTATLECAGNRRSEMSQVRKTEGIQWSSGVIGNLAWVGLSLRTLLLAHHVPDPYAHLTPDELAAVAPTEENIRKHAAAWAHEAHVHFVSAQVSDLLELDPAKSRDEERERNRWFASSVSLATAMLPAQQCLLSWGLCSNAADILPTRTTSQASSTCDADKAAQPSRTASEARIEPLEHAHGFPLRAVLPGHAGARWVKWIRALRIERAENASAPMRDDYKMLLPPPGSVDVRTSAPAAGGGEWVAALKDQRRRAEIMEGLKPMMRLSAGSAVSSPAEGQRVVVSSSSSSTHEGRARRTVRVRGYAVGQDGSAVQSVSLCLVPDADAALSVPELRALAASSPPSAWQDAHTLTRDEGQLDQLARHHKADPPRWVWSWTLWETDLEVGAALEEAPGTKKWALVVKSVTTAGVEQVQTAPWNIRGFCQRSWPVVRGLELVEA